MTNQHRGASPATDEQLTQHRLARLIAMASLAGDGPEQPLTVAGAHDDNTLDIPARCRRLMRQPGHEQTQRLLSYGRRLRDRLNGVEA